MRSLTPSHDGDRGITHLAAACGLLSLNGPVLVSAGREALHDYKINSPGYKAKYGHWSMLSVPDDMRVNAVHAALLRTGKVLIIAGSGNNRRNFKAGTFKTILWDPKTDKFTRVPTPSDMFCAGHVFLPDGKLLIAGGTKRYEVLGEDVTHAAGVMTIKNEDPDALPMRLERAPSSCRLQGTGIGPPGL